LEGVKILLNGGADPTAKNEDGHTPSEVALDKRHGNIATVLSRPSKIA
jgi:ankyrin repeat protein